MTGMCPLCWVMLVIHAGLLALLIMFAIARVAARTAAAMRAWSPS